VRAILPSPETGGRCVAVIRLRGTALTSPVAWSATRPLLDACSFFDAFGEPGPRIRATLDSAAFSSARLYLPAASDSARHSRGRSAILDEYGDLDAYRCSTGLAAVCDSLVLSTASQRRFASGYWWEGNQSTVAPLAVTSEGNRWFSGALFDAVAADLGPERFQRLWSSGQSLADAYQALAGQPIGALAQQAVAPRFRRSGQYGQALFQPMRRGTAALGSNALTLAALALLLLAATRMRRPTVG
jgi:hypothetical protein